MNSRLIKIRKLPVESHKTGHIVMIVCKKFKPDLLPVFADCRSTSLEEPAKPAHPTSRSATQLSRKNLRLNDFGSTSWVNGSRVLICDPRDPPIFVDPYDPRPTDPLSALIACLIVYYLKQLQPIFIIFGKFHPLGSSF